MYNSGLAAAAGGTTVAVFDGGGVASAGRVQDSSVVVDAPVSASPTAPEVAAPARADVRKRRGSRFQAVLLGSDLAAAVAGALAAIPLRFGDSDLALGRDNVAFAYLLPVLWIVAVAATRGYEARFVGVGSAEFDRVLRAFLYATVGSVFLAAMTSWEVSRGYMLASLGLTLVFAVIGRCAARKRLHAARARGRYLTSVIAVGDVDAVREFAERASRDVHAGMRVVGACLVNPQVHDVATLEGSGVRSYGDVDCVASAIEEVAADRVVVLAGGVSPQKLRWISWQLEGTDTDLVVAPGLVEVAGRRLHVHPAAGVPLLHIEEPKFDGFQRAIKCGFDRFLALLALVALAPLLLLAAALVRLTSEGPALFSQERVGVNGSTFRLYKFRSMVVDAEARLAALEAENEHTGGPLFKMKRDPRVTRFGAILRKYSIDELPQLINVVKGNMSLVGPRPPLPKEVQQYGSDVHRRLLVKPGITGLWQVSGRSDLSWDESVQLDLRYVENWSMGSDLLILWKTFAAVRRGAGAY